MERKGSRCLRGHEGCEVVEIQGIIGLRIIRLNSIEPRATLRWSDLAYISVNVTR